MAIKNDSDWLRRSFLVSSTAASTQDMFRRELTEAEFKFTDTTLGGNFAINPPPQFCDNADIRVESRFAGSQGMGRYYSEALDDHGELIHMRFGVPQFNSLKKFFTNFYNGYSSTLANRGRAPGIFYDVGNLIGTIVTAPIQPILWMNKAVNFLSNKETSRYYYLKPAMPLYWNAVQTLVNTLGVNMGMIGHDQRSAGEEAIKKDFDPSVKGESQALSSIWTNVANMSEIFREDGGIDVYALATRAQRMANKNREAIQEVLETDKGWDKLSSDLYNASKEKISDDPKPDFRKYVDDYHKKSLAKVDIDETGSQDSENADWGAFEADSFGDFLNAELRDGSAFVTFRVDNTDTISESFTNSTGEAPIKSKLNGMASSNRETRFSLADGNLGDGLLMDAIEGFIGSAKDLLTGGLDSVGLGGLAAFSGRAFVEIPDIWTDSSADLPKMNYTIQLRTPYNNPLSRMQNLYVPLCMILAGGLPLSTGKQSYTSPFLVELYSQGRNQTRLGIIDSISITRGVGNLGWNNIGEPMGIDVTFSVTDLSTIMHMPIVSKFKGSVLDSVDPEISAYLDKDTYDDDNTFTDYMAILGGLSLADQIYPVNKLRLRAATRKAQWRKMRSPAYHANWMAGTGLGRLASAAVTSTLEYQNSR